MIPKIRLRTLFQEYILALAMVILLALGLFFPDGKQMPLDTVMAFGVIGLYVLIRLCVKKRHTIGSAQTWAWAGLLVYLGIRTVFSDDVGYSIYTLIRFIEAFLVYYLFVCYSGKQIMRIFIGGLMVISVSALFIAVGTMLFPGLLGAAPQMSLLYRTYGHNHAADIVLFGFSISSILWVVRNRTRYLLLTVLCIAGSLLFFARTVVVLEALLLGGMFVYFMMRKHRTHTPLLLVGLLSAIAAIILFVLPYANLRTASTIFPSFGKQSVVGDERWEYWRQSAVALSAHPLFGSGPGTFVLQSKLYQKEPNAYSWFAHNFFLEFSVENGLVGLAFLLCLIVIIARNVRVRSNILAAAVLASVVLSTAQSVFDYNLDYVVIWLLVWAALGAVSQADESKYTGVWQFLPLGSVIVVGMFAVMNMFLAYPLSAANNSPLFLSLCAHKLQCADSLLSSWDIQNRNAFQTFAGAVRFFHKRNPQAMALLAAHYEKTKETEKSYDAYYQTITLDPQDNRVYEKYSSLLLEAHRPDLLLGVIQQMVRMISIDPIRDAAYVEMHWDTISSCFSTKTLLWPNGSVANTYLAKSIYFAGLCLVKNHQFDEARQIMRIASDARTSWSNMYLDYAGLSFWRYHDTKAARQAMKFCKSNNNSKKHCAGYDGKPLPRVSVTDADAQFIQ